MAGANEVDKLELLDKIDGESDDGNKSDYGTIPDQPNDLPNEGTLLTKELMILVSLSVVGGFLFGYDTGIVSGAMLALKVQFRLSYLWQEMIISSTVAAAAVSSAIAGPISDWIGRRPVILIAGSLYVVGAVIMASVNIKELFLLGRLVIGFGIGFASMIMPVYISESSPKQYRGPFTAGFNFLIASGQTIAAITAGLFFPNKKDGWRYMLGLAAVPGLIQFIGFLFMPESPRYLVAKGKDEQARRVLAKLRPSWYAVDKELEKIKAGYYSAMKAAKSEGSTLSVFYKMLQYGSTRRALLIGGGLQMFQQLIGINTVLYYMATIIQMGGIKDPQTAVWVAAGIATINAIGAGVGTMLVESRGRRKLTLVSLFGVMLSLAFLAIGFQVISSTSPSIEAYVTPPVGTAPSDCSTQSSCSSCINHQNCGFCYFSPTSHSVTNGSCLPTLIGYGEKSTYGPCHDLTNNTNYHWTYMFCPTDYSWFAIVGLLAYVITFSPGMGPMPWTVNSEIYPTWARSTGVAFSTGVNWTFNLIISMSFLSLTLVITRAGTFWLYAVIALIGFIYFYIFLPETKGKTLEEMEQVFSTPWNCRLCHI